MHMGTTETYITLSQKVLDTLIVGRVHEGPLVATVLVVSSMMLDWYSLSRLLLEFVNVHAMMYKVIVMALHDALYKSTITTTTTTTTTTKTLQDEIVRKRLGYK